MLLFEHYRMALRAAALSLLTLIAACTVEPLAGSRSSVDATPISAELQATEVAPVTTREAQQVRNALIFALRGGQNSAPARYRVKLGVVSTAAALSIRSSSLAPTSARVVMNVTYTMMEIATGRIVAQGKRRTFAAYDRTTQSFANERAERDAENRAAREVAQQIRIALAQRLSGAGPTIPQPGDEPLEANTRVTN